MRITKNKKLGLFAVVMIACLTGGVIAAMTLSNAQSSAFTVYTELPMTLSWNTDPSDSYLTVGELAVGQLYWESLVTPSFTASMVITVNCPVAVTNLNSIAELYFDGSLVPFVSGVFVYTVSVGTLSGYFSGTWDMSFEIVSADGGSVDGAWSLDFVLEGDPI